MELVKPVTAFNALQLVSEVAALRASKASQKESMSEYEMNLKELAIRVATTEAETARLESNTHRQKGQIKHLQQTIQILTAERASLSAKLTSAREEHQEQAQDLQQRLTGCSTLCGHLSLQTPMPVPWTHTTTWSESLCSDSMFVYQ